MDCSDVSGGGPVQFIDRLHVPLHVSRLMLIARPEGASHRIEDHENTLMPALFFKTLDGCCERLGIDEAGSKVQLATDDNERNVRYAVFLTPCRNASFGYASFVQPRRIRQDPVSLSDRANPCQQQCASRCRRQERSCPCRVWPRTTKTRQHQVRPERFLLLSLSYQHRQTK